MVFHTRKKAQGVLQFLNDLSPPTPIATESISADELTNNDRLLDQIYKDLVRSRKNGFAFYQASPKPSLSVQSYPSHPMPAHQQSAYSAYQAPTIFCFDWQQSVTNMPSSSRSSASPPIAPEAHHRFYMCRQATIWLRSKALDFRHRLAVWCL